MEVAATPALRLTGPGRLVGPGLAWPGYTGLGRVSAEFPFSLFLPFLFLLHFFFLSLLFFIFLLLGETSGQFFPFQRESNDYLLAQCVGQRLRIDFYVLVPANFLTTLRSHLNVICSCYYCTTLRMNAVYSYSCSFS